MSRRRILMLITNTGFGGAERSFSNVCAALAESHDVHACTFDAWQEGHHPVPVPLHELRVAGGRNAFDKLQRLKQRVGQVRKLKRELDVDVCISFLEGADYTNVLSRGRERVVLSVRGSKVHDENIRGALGALRQRVLLPLVFRQADAIVALSEGVGTELRTECHVPAKVPIHVIPNFFDETRIGELASQPVPSALSDYYVRRDVLVSHGRLSREKGLHHLLDVLRRLRSRRRQASLLLVGDGPARDELTNGAASRGLSSVWLPTHAGGPVDADVVFTGHDGNPFRYLPRAKAFVLASSAEGFGNSIVEAMLTGLPALCVDCPYGPREILAPGTVRRPRLAEPEQAAHGLLLPTFSGGIPHDAAVAVWVDALERLLADEDARAALASKGRNRASDFRHDAIGARWRSTVERLTSKAHERTNEFSREVL